MFNFQLDRALSVGPFRAAMRILQGASGSGIPILMYHSIRSGIQSSSAHPYYQTNTSPETFAEQMLYLRRSGYQAVSLGDAIEALRTNDTSSKRVVITFDDGYRDFYTTSFPTLADCGFTATVFVVSSFARSGTDGNGNHYMTWSQLREIHSEGITLGSHTVSHPVLHELGPERIDQELRQSKETIEQEIGSIVGSFSFPYAFPEHDSNFIRFVRGKLESIGYQSAVSTVIGTAANAHDRYMLPRLGINSRDDQRFFAAKLERAYDWMHAAQSLRKRFTGHSLWQYPQAPVAGERM